MRKQAWNVLVDGEFRAQYESREDADAHARCIHPSLNPEVVRAADRIEAGGFTFLIASSEDD